MISAKTLLLSVTYVIPFLSFAGLKAARPNDGFIRADVFGPTWAVQNFQASPDGSSILVNPYANGGQEEGNVFRVDAKTGEILGSWNTYADGSGKFSPDGKKILTVGWLSSRQHVLDLWDVATGKKESTFVAAVKQPLDSFNYVWHTQFSADAKRLIVESEHQVDIFNTETSGAIATLPAYSSVTSGEGTFTATYSDADQTIRVFRTIDGSVVRAFQSPTTSQSGRTPNFAFAPNGQKLVSTTQTEKGTVVHFVSLIGDDDLKISVAPESDPFVYHFSSDGKRLLLFTRHASKGYLFNLNTSSRLATMDFNSPITQMEFSPDGKYYFSPSGNKINLFKADTGDFVRELSGDFAKFSSTGKILAVRDEVRFNFYATQDGKLLSSTDHPVDGLGNLNDAIAFAHDDSKFFAIENHGGNFDFAAYDLATGAKTVLLSEPWGGSYSKPVFSTDDSRVYFQVDDRRPSGLGILKLK